MGFMNVNKLIKQCKKPIEIVISKRITKKYIFLNNEGEKLVFIGCPPTRTNQFEWKGKIYELKEVITYGI